MIKLCKAVCLVLAGLVWSFSATAAPQWCFGTISIAWIDPVGNLLIVGSWRGDHTLVCGLDQPWKGIPTKVCAAWFSMLNTARILNSPVIIFYPDAAACNALPTYGNSLAPGYIMQSN